MNSLAESIARVVLGVILGSILLSIFGWAIVLGEIFNG